MIIFIVRIDRLQQLQMRKDCLQFLLEIAKISEEAESILNSGLKIKLPEVKLPLMSKKNCLRHHQILRHQSRLFLKKFAS